MLFLPTSPKSYQAGFEIAKSAKNGLSNVLNITVIEMTLILNLLLDRS